MLVPLVLAAILPPVIEQIGKTVRAKIRDKGAADKEIAALKARIEALELRARWSA